MSPHRTDYTVSHAYSLRLVESPKFTFMKLQPDKIYYVGGYGVNSAFVDVAEFEEARPDILALEVLVHVFLCARLVGAALAVSRTRP